ncbi:hypothetical protein KX729_29875 [Rhizobium sp. XQZ8]|nr:hypothetical protein [Rhizobium populisoli]MBW6425617.1 hypothetical protein [Rhizobium populisoli]
MAFPVVGTMLLMAAMIAALVFMHDAGRTSTSRVFIPEEQVATRAP